MFTRHRPIGIYRSIVQSNHLDLTQGDGVTMGIFTVIRDHAAIASGNFASMFKDVEIPPLPAAVANLLEELNKPEPNIARLETIITTEPEIAARILRTVNSSLYALKSRVLSIRHAIALLGIKQIRTLLLSYALRSAIPKPDAELFDHEAYWADTLLRSLLARSLAAKHRHGEEEEAFTAMLVADIALPVLLSTWAKYYRPIVEQWRSSELHLSEIERQDFGWDHAQAGAWILQSWSFPDEFICLAGTHNLSPEQLQELGLADTVALPIAIAALVPSILKSDPTRSARLVESVNQWLELSESSWMSVLEEVENSFTIISEQFNLSADYTKQALTSLAEIAPDRGDES